MKTLRLYQRFLGLGILVILLAVGLAVQQVFARPNAETAAQISPLHPTFMLVDSQGVSVLESGEAVSTMQTCGQCHDTGYIASHSFHADLGQGSQTAPGEGSGSMPWETSTGLYGDWDPLTYRYLSPAGDANPDLDTADWVIFNAERLVGGGPAEASGVEMNCFLCHLEQPNDVERVAAIQAGEGQWASTATLLGTGIVERSGEQYVWNQAAFTDDGELDSNFVNIQDPTNANCAQCHGLAQDGGAEPLVLAGCSLDNWQTATTGQVISGDRISDSGMNIADKGSLTRSWDIHAERGLQCTDCHFSLNNPAYYQAEVAPSHLEFDPRRLEIGSYLEKPDHNFARGQSAQYTIAPELKGTMRRCESCHNTNSHADWLPYVERHMEEVACETCHTPQMSAGAVQSYDWTVLTADSQPAAQCRGIEGDTGTIVDLVTGFQPVAMQRTNVDGDTMLAPYNLITSWYWVYEDAAGPRPVPLEELQAAWLDGGNYAAEVLQAFDADQDGQLSAAELRLDTPEKQALIAGRLAGLGLTNPRIEGVVQPYSINHNVTRGEWAVSDCQACHSDDSRLAEPMALAAYLPGGVMPAFAADTNTLVSDRLTVVDGALYYSPDLNEAGLYVFGHNRANWVDWLGALFFVGVLGAVAGHSGLRAYSSLRRPKGQPAIKRVYMYAVYERFWHWLQTFTIVLLLFTGLIIHRPDLFGFLSFRHMVTLHNVLAVILVVNAGLSLFYHLVSGEIRQYIPRPYGFFDQAIVQAKYYIQGIFKGDAHPFEKTMDKKLNPLQQVTYFGILNVLLPLQIITGALMWGVQEWPEIADMLGGLPFLAPFHSLVAWLFGAFIVAHVYLTTTGYKPLTGIKAMMSGWEDMEDHEAALHEAPITEASEDSQAAVAE
ncbi:MAG TPA: cytochrome b/b6 domain-containing protein [Anaerolineales bacterium]|nr:cytochrome b/b6 domain-containing protein [Anaerolineales bacterium]